MIPVVRALGLVGISNPPPHRQCHTVTCTGLMTSCYGLPVISRGTASKRPRNVLVTEHRPRSRHNAFRVRSGFAPRTTLQHIRALANASGFDRKDNANCEGIEGSMSIMLGYKPDQHNPGYYGAAATGIPAGVDQSHPCSNLYPLHRHGYG